MATVRQNANASTSRPQSKDQHDHDRPRRGGLAVGTLNWGTTPIDAWLNGGTILTQMTLDGIVDQCMARGTEQVIAFDTAEGYGGGSSETRLAHALRAHQKTSSSSSSLPSSSLSSSSSSSSLSSSSSAPSPLVASKYLPTLWRWTYGAFERALRGSLARLRLSTMPLYFIHTPIHALPLEHLLSWCVRAANKGLIRHIGLSNVTAAQLERSTAYLSRQPRRGGSGGRSGYHRVHTVQLLINLLDYNAHAVQDVLCVARRHDIDVWAYSPVAQGLLCDNLQRAKFDSTPLTRMTRITWSELCRVRVVVKRVADAHACTMAQVALAWTMAHGFTALVGMNKPHQAADNLRACDVVLSVEDVVALDAVALTYSTLAKPRWRRVLFVTFISALMLVYRVCLWWTPSSS